MKNDSLHNLIIRISNGDSSAFDTLYVKMRDPLCRKILGRYSRSLSRADAEDAVQNAFIRIRLHASSYHGKHDEASARSWMNTIALREALKIADAGRRLSASLDDQDGSDNYTGDQSAIPERNLYKRDALMDGKRPVEDRAERAFLLGKVLASAEQCLSIDEMKLLSMRFVLEYTFEQIGREIGKTKVRAKQIIDGLIERIRRSIGVDISHFDGL